MTNEQTQADIDHAAFCERIQREDDAYRAARVEKDAFFALEDALMKRDEAEIAKTNA